MPSRCKSTVNGGTKWNIARNVVLRDRGVIVFQASGPIYQSGCSPSRPAAVALRTSGRGWNGTVPEEADIAPETVLSL